MKQFLETRLGFFCAGAALYGVILSLEILAASGPVTLTKMATEGLELALMFTGIFAIVRLRENIRHEAAARSNLLVKLREVREESNEWRTKAQTHLAGLVQSIRIQCDKWGFTPAERDVALLMLKGLSHKEIAILRNTHESTVRQQARSIYSKADMNSRREFCAYFLDDLLPSVDDAIREDDNVVNLRANES